MQPPLLTRVYVPTTVAGLRQLLHGWLPVSQAFAVTDRLRALLAVPAGDPGIEDELAEAAVVAAADACLALLAEDPAAPRWRVVVAADVAAAVADQAAEAAHPAGVTCEAGISLAAVASLLADEPDDVEAQGAVLAVMTAQRNGSESDVEDALDTLDDHGLAWFDVGELADLIDRVGRG